MSVHDINVVLRLLNNRRFVTGMSSSAASIRGFSSAVERTSSASSGLAAASGAAEVGLYGVGAAARAATFAVGAATAGFTALGVQFNATMEGNELAFEHFAGGVEGSKALVQDLFNIAKETPFSFTDITTAGRKFLAFGYTVAETKSLLDTLGDTLSYVGGGPLEIQRITKAFGDIRAKGRLMQQELNQLTNVGINPYEMLAKGGLALTEKQLKNVGAAHIKADDAITALQRGLEMTFGGGSEKYLETFNGQWQRLKDNISQAAGGATKSTGIFGGLKDVIKGLNDWVEANGSTINRVYSGVVKVVGGFLVAAFTFAKTIITDFLDALKPAQPFFENVLLPLIKGLAVGIGATLVGAWKIGMVVLKAFMWALGAIGTILKPIKPAFYVIGWALSLLVGGVIKAITWLSKLRGVFGFIGKVAWLLLSPIRLLINVFGKVGAVIAAQLGGVISIAKDFGDKIGGVFDWLKDKIEWVIDKIKWILDKAGPLKDVVGAIVPGGDTGLLSGNGLLGIGGIPVLGTGGDVMGGGWAVVGDKGPELVNLPPGATVLSNEAARVRRHRSNGMGPSGRSVASSDTKFSDINLYVKSDLVVSKRVLATAVGEATAERAARS